MIWVLFERSWMVASKSIGKLKFGPKNMHQKFKDTRIIKSMSLWSKIKMYDALLVSIDHFLQIGKEYGSKNNKNTYDFSGKSNLKNSLSKHLELFQPNFWTKALFFPPTNFIIIKSISHFWECLNFFDVGCILTNIIQTAQRFTKDFVVFLLLKD